MPLFRKTKAINTLRSITKKNRKDRAGIEQIKWSLYQWHVCFCNPRARAELPQQERERKLCSATLNEILPCNRVKYKAKQKNKTSKMPWIFTGSVPVQVDVYSNDSYVSFAQRIGPHRDVFTSPWSGLSWRLSSLRTRIAAYTHSDLMSFFGVLQPSPLFQRDCSGTSGFGVCHSRTYYNNFSHKILTGISYLLRSSAIEYGTTWLGHNFLASLIRALVWRLLLSRVDFI